MFLYRIKYAPPSKGREVSQRSQIVLYLLHTHIGKCDQCIQEAELMLTNPRDAFRGQRERERERERENFIRNCTAGIPEVL